MIDLELNIARARLVLSLVTLLSIFVDPTRPHFAAWVPVTTGFFAIDRLTLSVLAAHFAYGLAVLVMLRRGHEADVVGRLSTAWDIAFAVVIALLTEGPTSPSFAFFAFAIIAVGCRTGFRATATVTMASVLLYLAIVLLLTPGERHLYVMRPAYLAITGYLIGFLGQQRVNFEERVRELETLAERQNIARFLHDGYAQGLAGVNLRLESCRQMLQGGRTPDALAELTELQAGVTREFDDVRGYIRSLAAVESVDAAHDRAWSETTRVQVRAVFSAPGAVVEDVFQIVLEAVRNVRRHAHARSAIVDAAQDARGIRITIDDDGVGFRDPSTPPWSIASRIAEVGGRVRIVDDPRPGAHLEIDMPVSHHDDAHPSHHRG